MTTRIPSLPQGLMQLTSRPTTTSLGLPGVGEVVVLALASSRLTRAIALDEISAPVRDRLASKAEGGAPVWVWGSKLLSCPGCVGWWVSFAISAVLPGRRRVLRGAAVAGGQVFLALLERLVSERGREAISSADLAEARAADGESPPVGEQAP